MYFNYPSEFILPHWLEESIFETRELIRRADEELKFGISESFESIPFNLVITKPLQEKFLEIRERFFRAFEKIPPTKNNQDIAPWDSFQFSKYHSLLRDSFDFRPFSLLVKKGVSSSGKEVLVFCEDYPMPLFLYHTVYPLCWSVIDEKNKFSISRHPVYPLFYRYMQEPLAVAMSLAVIDKAFGNESRAMEYVVDRLQHLPMNYLAGTLLFNSGLYMRWKDWRDDSKRCQGKIGTIMEWIDLLSNTNETPQSEQLISLWAKLFDLTAGEVQGLNAAAKYAPIVSENTNLSKLLIGLIDFAVKNPNDFRDERVKQSRNPIAIVVNQLVSKQISLTEALAQVDIISKEQLIRDFIGNVMSGWSFAQDLHDGCFRIYGPTVIAIAYNSVKNKDESASSKTEKGTEDN